jgi:hypothetical protein
MPRAKELKVRVENRPGMLGEVASALGEKKINLRAAHAWSEGEAGYVRLVPEQTGAARKALAARGWPVDEREVLEVVLADKPGALGDASRKLGTAGIDIEYMYVGSAGAARKVSAFFGVADVAAALKASR